MTICRAAFLALFALAAACSNADCCNSTDECSMAACSGAVAAPVATTLIGRADVFLAGRNAGSVRCLQGAGEAATTVTTVVDQRGTVVGFVQADGTALRNTAAGSVRVGQGNDLRELVALVFDVRDGSKAELKAVHGHLVPGFPGHR